LEAAGFRAAVLDSDQISKDSFVNIVRSCNPKIIGFYVSTDSLPKVQRSIELLRAKNAEPSLIIFGGPHVTIADRDLLNKDYGQIVVRGEGEETTVEIAKWWLLGEGRLEEISGISYRTTSDEIIRNPDREQISNLDRLPEPNLKLLIKEPKSNILQIITGRGCPFNCTFCVEGIMGKHYRFRSPESVLQEIRHLIGDEQRVYLSILDDTFLVDRGRVETIAKSLIDEYGDSKRIVWFCEGRVDFICRNSDLFPLLREAGLVRIQIGIESGNQEVLDLYRKGITVADIETAVSILCDADIPSIFGNFIIGGPNENPRTIKDSINLAKRLVALAPGRMECTASILALFPGTAISETPSQFGLRVIDPHMLRGISLQHPVAVTETMGVNDTLKAFHEFNQSVMQAYEAALPLVPLSVIRRHFELRSYGVTTPWSNVLERFPTIGNYYGMLKCEGYASFSEIKKNELLNMVPRRTIPVLDVEDDMIVVKSHPRKVLFNEMAASIYELCSGKLTIKEIINALQQNIDFLPPEPFLFEQVVEILKELDDRFLVIFSDLG
jgi:anaerobic magnesium-protoporphyrin IX monomethyl ester cyclase